MRFPTAIACCLLSLIASCAFADSLAAGHATADSALSFVQDFYDWYVPKALDPKGEVASDLALQQKRAFFSQRLAQALKADSAAQAKSPDSIVGLDGDPFLDSQDPCERYLTGAVTQTGKRYAVEVFAVCSGKKNTKPDVVAELIRQGNSWVFVNFIYPGDGDLLAILKSLQQERDKTPK